MYRRVVRKGIDGGNLRRRAMRNSCTSVYLWVLSLVSIVPATFFWDTPIALAGATIAFVAIYVHIYVAIVRIRAAASGSGCNSGDGGTAKPASSLIVSLPRCCVTSIL